MEPVAENIDEKEVHTFYLKVIELMDNSGIPYVLGGGAAVAHYAGETRHSKDLDIFIRHSDFGKAMKLFDRSGFETQLFDVRWLFKIFSGKYFVDVIFNTVNNICRVDDAWFERASVGEFLGRRVKFKPAEELIWCKSYVWNRERFDGADINHIILKYGKNLDWKHLLDRIEPHWHLLLAEILLFQFVYPSEYTHIIPRWLFEELMARAHEQYELPPPYEQVCLGPLIDSTQYGVDVKEWNYKSNTIKTV